MAKKDNSLLAVMKARLDETRRQLGFAAMDFSVSDERLLELRTELRSLQDEVKTLERKSRKLFGIF
jgi:hypothetical protein